MKWLDAPTGPGRLFFVRELGRVDQVPEVVVRDSPKWHALIDAQEHAPKFAAPAEWLAIPGPDELVALGKCETALAEVEVALRVMKEHDRIVEMWSDSLEALERLAAARKETP